MSPIVRRCEGIVPLCCVHLVYRVYRATGSIESIEPPNLLSFISEALCDKLHFLGSAVDSRDRSFFLLFYTPAEENLQSILFGFLFIACVRLDYGCLNAGIPIMLI